MTSEEIARLIWNEKLERAMWPLCEEEKELVKLCLALAANEGGRVAMEKYMAAVRTIV